eukprot:TRINITY_DN1419_c0_g1_i1.p1 TRINITY_DN1419_c0_g1~~TRINITY_DN1419_c0_g1_i1.p1  ORF type:complete len:185 (+),score=30.12 TRINITY_DN1419_c0_g1_i1:64-618(+)
MYHLRALTRVSSLHRYAFLRTSQAISPNTVVKESRPNKDSRRLTDPKPDLEAGVPIDDQHVQLNSQQKLTLEGVPEIYLNRRVTITKPLPNAMQSLDSTDFYVLQWPNGKNWSDKLMGWTATNDASNGITSQLRFNTVDQAITYCKDNGIQFEVAEEITTELRKKNYGDKFKYKPVRSDPVDIV